jgi:hypothetical protein
VVSIADQVAGAEPAAEHAQPAMTMTESHPNG